MYEALAWVFTPYFSFALRDNYQLKAHYKKSAGARTFARLMTLLDSGAGGKTLDTSSNAGHDHDSPKGKHSKVGQHLSLFFVFVDQPPRLFFALTGDHINCDSSSDQDS